MAQQAQITPKDIAEMVRHWLDTPPEGYLGSPYGADLKALLHRPQSDPAIFEGFIQKMRRDLPVLNILPQGFVRSRIERDGNDQLVLKVDVQGVLITSGGANA